MKKYKYERTHICGHSCNPIKGQHDYNLPERLCRVNRKGKFIHISYDRERDGTWTAKKVKEAGWIKLNKLPYATIQ